MHQFRERFGPITRSPHLEFCREMNLAVIEAYQPKAVILPGIATDKLCANLYGLRRVETVYEGATRVVEVYSDGRRPWLFTKHWTGSFGLTKSQREKIRDTIRQS